ncbi:Zinc finger, RING/FYVE/PHD-type [Metarhizium guizhouense ARSEF 977]|uniref:RING-type E3 ubiquitin transferase n=1 Tax=Metarhizium guizhouense (strain ARSEF 977) TaxID=1276136 RepID=A0A0B4HUL5_METGA|nr:Zinc finger, RING/FYVE/PHD-type [Metarhizium guizhouense ARSEF 977]
MAARDNRDGHLHATSSREVVFCHACCNEWYGDDYGLTCPYCESEITEIVSPENDPRSIGDASNPAPPELFPVPFAEDPVPDETYIQEHLGLLGFHFGRSPRTGTVDRHRGPSFDPTFQPLQDTAQRFSQPRQNESTSVFTGADDDSYALPQIQRTTTTFTSGAPGGETASEDPSNRGNIDLFQALRSILSNAIRDILLPQVPGEVGTQLGFARNLQEISSRFSPGITMMGDAVYSQEALDRFITQLMEANPQSSAAPPASPGAIDSLERRTVDRELLGPEGRVECSICTDEIKVRQTVVVLPCKHWFHENCVVLWLREHNTCPVCRNPIERT